MSILVWEYEYEKLLVLENKEKTICLAFLYFIIKVKSHNFYI